MLGKRQFSLGYLLLEISLVGAAMGMFRAATALPEGYEALGLVLLVASVGAGGAAIGGLFGRMLEGVFWAIAFGILAALFMPAVMYA